MIECQKSNRQNCVIGMRPIGYSIIELIANIPMENAIEAIMSTELETIDVTETAQEAAKKMNDKRVSSVLVVDKNKGDNPIGIVTERDLVIRICADGASS